ncbi:ABC-three component system middle component 6 [Prevotella sp. oral taxon 376]|uniref:ABC-three component system middle component 6 n=1 Tax=Prevotella sp. oral taxon 376 TaxID=712466 RepID=UPI001E5E9710|nr:ABC-three component system middle component 6 [Prevotella sp. oral taxon 376]
MQNIRKTLIVMLMPDNIRPKNSIYYNGALVLKVLQETKEQELLELYQAVLEEVKMSFSVYILCLDWLYLINVAKLKKEKVILCS